VYQIVSEEVFPFIKELYGNEEPGVILEEIKGLEVEIRDGLGELERMVEGK